MVIQKATGTDEAQEHGLQYRKEKLEGQERKEKKKKKKNPQGPAGHLQSNIIYSYEIHIYNG
jgi:hypothetical protein